MKKYNIKMTATPGSGCNDMNEEGLPATTVVNVLNRYANDICTPKWNGESFQLSDNYTMIITEQRDMKTILEEIAAERVKQDAKWGQQNHPILDPMLLDRPGERMCEEYEIPSEQRAKNMTDIQAKRGDVTYMQILIEEISEAASCGKDVTALRKELIQGAAVMVAMIESLDRNGR